MMREERFRPYFLCKERSLKICKADFENLSFINYQKPPALRPPGGLFTRIQALLASSTSSANIPFFQYRFYLKRKKFFSNYIPLIEKVESCKFLCPSNRGPFDDGVTTAESGSVGIQSGTEIFGFGLS